MTGKQEAMDWIKANNRWGNESGKFLAEFEVKLDDAIKKQDNVATTWIMGGGLSGDGSPYQLQWFTGFFLADKISVERAKEFNVEEMQIITMERDIVTTTKFEENEESNFSNEVSENINKAWDSISSIFPDSDEKEPISLEEINNFKMWVDKAKSVQNKTADDDLIIKDSEEAILIWEERKFDGAKRDLIVLLVLYGFAIFIKIITFFSGEIVTKTNVNVEQNTSFLGTVIGLIMLAGIIGYYWAYKAPVWLIDLRNSGPRKRLSDFFAKIAKRAFHTKVNNVTTYSDGSKTSSPSFLAGPIASFIIWCIYYYIFFQFIFIFTGYAAVKNYILYKR